MADQNTGGGTIIYQADGGGGSLSEGAILNQLNTQVGANQWVGAGGLIADVTAQDLVNSVTSALQQYTPASQSTNPFTVDTGNLNQFANLNTSGNFTFDSGVNITTGDSITTALQTVQSSTGISTPQLVAATGALGAASDLNSQSQGSFSSFIDNAKQNIGNVFTGIVNAPTKLLGIVTGSNTQSTGSVSSLTNNIAQAFGVSPSTYSSLNPGISISTGLNLGFGPLAINFNLSLGSSNNSDNSNTAGTGSTSTIRLATEPSTSLYFSDPQVIADSTLSINATQQAASQVGELDVNPNPVAAQDLVSQAAAANTTAVQSQTQNLISSLANGGNPFSTNINVTGVLSPYAYTISNTETLGTINIPNGSSSIYFNSNPVPTTTGWTPVYIAPGSSTYSVLDLTPTQIFFQNLNNGYVTVLEANPLANGGYGPIKVVGSVSTNPIAGFTPPVLISITPTAVPDAVIGTSYSVTFSAASGTGPYTFTTTDILPGGLTLTSAGTLSGTPTGTASTYTITVTATDSLGNTGALTVTFNLLAAAIPSSNTTTAPVSYPLPTPDTESFRFIKGYSVISPFTSVASTSVSAVVSAQYVGAEFTNAINQPIIVNVVNYTTGNIPAGTTVTLNDSTGNVLATAYCAGDEAAINLYWIPSTYNAVYTVTVTTNNNGVAWEAVTTLSATGTARIVQGSIRGAVWGPAAGNPPVGYGIDLYAGGNAINTYIRSVDIKGNFDYTIESSKYFGYRTLGSTVLNPNYGLLVSTNNTEIGYSSINNAVGSPFVDKILNTIIEFSVVQPLVQTTTSLELYTPYTFALTNQTVWLQTVAPYFQVDQGYSYFNIDWGDGNIEYLTSTVPTASYYFTHAYTQQSDTPYTVTVSAYNASRVFMYATTLTKQFYIQDVFPEIQLTDYSINLNDEPNLPFKYEQVKIGSNEWVTANNINAAFAKLNYNFQFLNTITKTIKKSPNLELIEWSSDLIQYPTWNTQFAGSNTYTQTYYSNYEGVTPGNIVEFKTYKSPYSAPDYYNYIIYTDPSLNSTLQVRKNDFYNTIVMSLTSIIPNALNFQVYSVEVSGTDMYVLASQNISQNINPVTLYKFNLNYSTGTAAVESQIGGVKGTKDDPYNFGITGPETSQYPTQIKLFNEKIYVADKTNGCIKVYNTSLTYQTTIYNNLLSYYDITSIDIDQSTGNLFVYSTIRSPNAPVITSITSQLTSNNQIQYAVTWNHDGNRLAQYNGATTNFSVSGQIAGSSNYTTIGSLSSDLTHFTDNAKLTTFIFSTSSTYVNFKVQALGQYQGYNSVPSSNIVTPNLDVFPSPFAIFVVDKNYSTIKVLLTPEVPPTANIVKILVEPTGVFFYVVTDSYLYKYTTTGIFVNRISDPSADSINEPIVNAFISDRGYIYIVTATRIFKYIDLPSAESLFDYNTISSYYSPLSSYFIGENEFVQDWVYNKAISTLLNNHEILAKSINSKYVTVLDTNDDIVSFYTRALSGSEIIVSLSATENAYIHSNEIVSAAVVNRALNYLYNVQEAILAAITPQVITQPADYLTNIIGLNNAATPNIIYQYIAPGPVIITQPQSQLLIVGESVTFTVEVTSVNGPDAIMYQWLYNGTPIPSATSASYTFIAEMSSIGTYSVSAYDGIGSVLSNNAQLEVNLGTQFAFASAQFIGNLYSNYLPTTNAGTLFTVNDQPTVDGTETHPSEQAIWLTTRYGNDYTAVVSVLNATTTSELVLNLSESHGSTPGTFGNKVTITVSHNNAPVYTTQTSVSGIFTIPLSSILSTDSSSIGSDGYPGLSAGDISISLSIGSTTSTNISIPKLVVTVKNGGYLYNATFQNNLYGSLAYGACYMTLLSLSGSVPYTSVINNTIGGLLDTGIDPYTRYEWALDGTTTTLNPVANYTAISTNTLTLSATRRLSTATGNDQGETEVVLSMGRVSYEVPKAPSYTIATSTSQVAGSTGGKVGQGYVTGGGTYKAGTVVTLYGNGTQSYYYGPGQSFNAPIVVAGAGVYDAGRYNKANILPLNATGFSNALGTTGSGSVRFNIYVDGDKSVQVYFHGP